MTLNEVHVVLRWKQLIGGDGLEPIKHRVHEDVDCSDPVKGSWRSKGNFLNLMVLIQNWTCVCEELRVGLNDCFDSTGGTWRTHNKGDSVWSVLDPKIRKLLLQVWLDDNLHELINFLIFKCDYVINELIALNARGHRDDFAVNFHDFDSFLNQT